LNQGKPEDAAERYLVSTYRQHNPTVGTGREQFVNFAKGFVKQFPQLRFDFKRIIAEGDLVVVHSHLKVNDKDRGTAVIDIFRLENGKIVEHWDVMQPLPEKSANDNTMF
jgi:predicted SnoaL-like aldol condensation-catalyzing enzyme